MVPGCPAPPGWVPGVSQNLEGGRATPHHCPGETETPHPRSGLPLGRLRLTPSRGRWEMDVVSCSGCTRRLVPVPSRQPQCHRAYSCRRRMSTASARLFTYASGFTWGWFSSEGLHGRHKGMAEHGRAPKRLPRPRPSCCCAHGAQGSAEVAPDG